MSIVITGATGQLGRLVVADLLARGTAPGDIAAAVRDAGKAADLAALGVDVRIADYERPETLKTAFEPGDKVLLISSSSADSRAAHHFAAVDAAARAGVALLAYTGILGGPYADLMMAEPHQVTEAHILASGLPYVFLRNGWYHENYTGHLGAMLGLDTSPRPYQWPVVEPGAFLGNAGSGRIASAARADYAEAAAVILTGDGHAGRAYELSGETAWSLAEYAAVVTEVAGRPLEYRDLPAEAHREILVGAGLPEVYAHVLVDTDAAIARGSLAATGGELSRLIGRPTTPLRASVEAALANLRR
jgi:NAD(P)H dehydrogenase (quinone)